MTLNPIDPAHGEEWEVVDFVFLKNGRPRGDGDTVTMWRTGIKRLGDKRFRVTDEDPQGARLVWVDTPEKTDPGYAQADLDLDTWILERLRAGRTLRAICYDGGAGWDRLLVDLVDDAGESASEYLMRPKELGGCGWPMYEGKG
jgi:hypothetical protein